MNKNTTRAKIIEVVKETPHSRSFVLEPLQGAGLQYEAGQFITLVFGKGPAEKRRSYSFSSAPLLHELPAITVKEVANGEFSRPLVQHAKTGDVLTVSSIGGFFRLPEDSSSYDQVFFFAAGSGITPCFSLIKTLLATTQKQMVLVYSNRSAGDTIFYQQLLQWHQRYPGRFRIVWFFSDSPDFRTSRISKPAVELIMEQYAIFPFDRILHYTCGPELYMEIIRISLISAGMPADNIRRESFDSRPRLFRPLPPDTGTYTVTIHHAGSTYEIAAGYPHSILAAAESLGISLPYSCRAGRCGSCVATCLSGKVWMAYNEVLTEADMAKGILLTCQAYPAGGPVTIATDASS